MTRQKCQKNFPWGVDIFAWGPARAPFGLHLDGEVGRIVLFIEDALDGFHIVGVENYRPLEVQAQLFGVLRDADHHESYEAARVLHPEPVRVGFSERHRVLGLELVRVGHEERHSRVVHGLKPPEDSIGVVVYQYKYPELLEPRHSLHETDYFLSGNRDVTETARLEAYC